MITGLNHLTLGVSDLDASCDFYVSTLGMSLQAKWKHGAYLLAGDLWLCLAVDEPSPAADYTHYAFSVTGQSLEAWQQKCERAGVVQWKSNRSEGSSLYLLDPDGHQLELHIGDLASRLAAIEQNPYEDLQLFDRDNL